MITYLRQLGIAVFPVLMLAVPWQAQATSSDVVLNLEGNPTCSSLADNSTIMEARDGDLIGPVAGPDGQVFSFSAANNVLGWSTAGPLPVNFVILKSKGNAGARVFHFGAAGVLSDSNEEATGTLSSVSFCYGLTGTAQQDPIYLGDCEDLDPMSMNDELDETGIVCPDEMIAGEKQRMLISLDITPVDQNGPDPINQRPNFRLQFCTCNVDSGKLKQCDPELPRGTAGACTNNPVGINTRVPILIQGVENPSSYICYTIGGRRTCYGEF